MLRFKKRSIITSLMDCYDMHRLMTMPKVFCSPSKARVIWKNHVMHSRNKFVLCWSNIIFILLLSTEPKPTVSNHFRKFICWSCCIQIIKAGNYWKRSFIVLVSVITCTGPCTQLMKKKLGLHFPYKEFLGVNKPTYPYRSMLCTMNAWSNVLGAQ